MMISQNKTYLWTAKKAHFKGHEPCPRCGSRDNLARYSDESAWCFGCHYREPGKRTITNSRTLINDKKDVLCYTTSSNSYRESLSSSLPKVAILWLKKYGLTNEECSNFKWSEEKQRLMVVLEREGEIVFWQGRRFGEDGPKYLSWGTIPWGVPLTFGDGGPLVFVEDVVSAIKVGHHAVGVPLFGSHLPATALKWAQEQRKPIGIWLDPDKRQEALKQALRASSIGVKVYTIFSERDPKEHTDAEIKAKIKDIEVFQ